MHQLVYVKCLMDREFEVDTRDPYVTELSCGYFTHSSHQNSLSTEARLRDFSFCKLKWISNSRFMCKKENYSKDENNNSFMDQMADSN